MPERTLRDVLLHGPTNDVEGVLFLFFTKTEINPVSVPMLSCSIAEELLHDAVSGVAAEALAEEAGARHGAAAAATGTVSGLAAPSNSQAARVSSDVTNSTLDVHGQVVDKTASVRVQCPNCSRQLAATKYAPHLEKCMGVGGRNVGRSRRQAALNAQSNLSEPVHDAYDTAEIMSAEATVQRIAAPSTTPAPAAPPRAVPVAPPRTATSVQGEGGGDRGGSGGVVVGSGALHTAASNRAQQGEFAGGSAAKKKSTTTKKNTTATAKKRADSSAAASGGRKKRRDENHIVPSRGAAAEPEVLASGSIFPMAEPARTAASPAQPAGPGQTSALTVGTGRADLAGPVDQQRNAGSLPSGDDATSFPTTTGDAESDADADAFFNDHDDEDFSFNAFENDMTFMGGDDYDASFGDSLLGNHHESLSFQADSAGSGGNRFSVGDFDSSNLV